MSNNKPKKKLQLHRDTLRTLSDTTLREVAGGYSLGVPFCLSCTAKKCTNQTIDPSPLTTLGG